MAIFEPAFNYMMYNEDSLLTGEVTPEPGGGKARFGINSIANPTALSDGFYEMEKNAALEYAKHVYQRNYWDGHGFDSLKSQQLASKLFDMAVNMGTGGSIRIVQLALRIPITYHMDTATKNAIQNAGPLFMSTLVDTLKKRYHEIYDSNPKKYKNVLDTWLGRASKLPPADK